ncbi:MAG: helix-turn-helix transcriptional regulator [Eubacteriales bacterium]
MNFAKTVKNVRQQLHLSQTQLADALNVSYTTINRWENGKVLPSNLAQKSFFDFCDNNFIDVKEIDEKKV